MRNKIHWKAYKVHNVLLVSQTTYDVGTAQQYYVFLEAWKPKASRCPGLHNSRNEWLVMRSACNTAWTFYNTSWVPRNLWKPLKVFKGHESLVQPPTEKSRIRHAGLISFQVGLYMDRCIAVQQKSSRYRIANQTENNSRRCGLT